MQNYGLMRDIPQTLDDTKEIIMKEIEAKYSYLPI